MGEDTNIVSIGGGTGLSNLLRGLKKTDVDLSVIVAVTDDGGSSGRLREEFGVLPPGDIRNCMAALSEDEALMSRLFRYRFSSEDTDGGLNDHSFGNFFLTAMAGVTGDFALDIDLQIIRSSGADAAQRLVEGHGLDIHRSHDLEISRLLKSSSEIAVGRQQRRGLRLYGNIESLDAAFGTDRQR